MRPVAQKTHEIFTREVASNFTRLKFQQDNLVIKGLTLRISVLTLRIVVTGVLTLRIGVLTLRIVRWRIFRLIPILGAVIGPYWALLGEYWAPLGSYWALLSEGFYGLGFSSIVIMGPVSCFVS